MLEAVLFDWGDTLMKYEWDEEVARAGAAAGLAALARAHLPQAEQIGLWFRERREELFGDGEDELDLAHVLSGCFSELGCRMSDDDVRLYMQASHAHWESGFSVPSTVHALLEALRGRGLRLGIVSNTVQPEWLLRPVLERQGLVERVDAIVLSSEVGKRKPHRLIFEQALDRLSARADRTVFVGDRLYQDVRGAGELGMVTVQALWFRADEHADGREPDFQAFTPVDVLNVARRLTGSTGSA